MKNVIKAMAVLLFAVMPVFASAQNGGFFRPTSVISEVELDNGAKHLMVFNMPEEGQNHYYVCVGTLGLGDDYIQVNIDPVSNLFLPLGDTLAEAQAKLEEIKGIAKQPVGTTFETPGCLSIGYPNGAEMEQISITHMRPLLTHLIEFSIRRNGYVRATHIAAGDFGSLIPGVKLYRKLHPKVQ